ncbi:unnamed protein product [Chondrus crispus]|uniref:Uncharacterized protein n=1 Tax=Chondrus crispus TaxID=2769 RepID=R7QDK2_CHOCR|nr:unnamed protein product [Chondrus crispus]CDF35511.1 unnamed protein product [Chondrus crispus]|eukprot:XP_005715330.1 unnamed protein product [Chondrus crispus]
MHRLHLAILIQPTPTGAVMLVESVLAAVPAKLAAARARHKRAAAVLDDEHSTLRTEPTAHLAQSHGGLDLFPGRHGEAGARALALLLRRVLQAFRNLPRILPFVIRNGLLAPQWHVPLALARDAKHVQTVRAAPHARVIGIHRRHLHAALPRARHHLRVPVQRPLQQEALILVINVLRYSLPNLRRAHLRLTLALRTDDIALPDAPLLDPALPEGGEALLARNVPARCERHARGAELVLPAHGALKAAIAQPVPLRLCGEGLYRVCDLARRRGLARRACIRRGARVVLGEAELELGARGVRGRVRAFDDLVEHEVAHGEGPL